MKGIVWGIGLIWAGVALGQQPCAPQVNLGSNISFCSGNAITLDAYWPNSSYNWSTGASTATITVTQSGTYWVTVTNNCGSTSDTIQIVASQPVNTNLGPDRNFCASTGLTLTVPIQSFTSYQWSTGSASNSITVNQAGTYWVAASNSCGTFRDTVTLGVDNALSFSLGPDITECQQDTIHLRAPASVAGASLLWTGGVNSDSLMVTQSGAYVLTATNACGAFRDTVQVNFQQFIDPIVVQRAQLCPGSSLTLSTNQSGTYLWSTGSTTSSISVTQPGIYTLDLTTPCGTINDTVEVYYPDTLQPDLGPDTLLCSSGALSLSTGLSQGSFTWSTGAGSSSISVNASGTYWVRVSNGCQFFYDTVQVTFGSFPTRPIADTLTYCPGVNSAVANVTQSLAGTSYLWSTGSTQATETFQTTGNQWVAISNACGSDTFDFYVKADAPRNIQIQGPDTVATCQTATLLVTGLSATDSLTWNTGGNVGENPITVGQAGTYIATVHNACGQYSDTAVVLVNQPPLRLQQTDYTICQGSPPLSLSVPAQPNSQTKILWSNGDTTRNTMLGPGTHTVQLSNPCDTVLDSIHIQAVQALQLNLGPDTVICQGGQVQVDVSTLVADTLYWSDGSQARVRQISQSDTLILTAQNACGTVRDTLRVRRILLPVEKLFDQAFCQGNTLTLNAFQAQAASYQWNTGSTDSAITISTSGVYVCTITNPCDTLVDSVRVSLDTSLGTVDLGKDTIFCAGTLVLDAGQHSGASYLWQDGSQNQTFTVTQSGAYYVTVTNSCGQRQDTIQVLITGPPVAVLGTSVRYCGSNTLTLNAQNPGSSYLWNTGDTTQRITVNTPGFYWVTITNACGSATDTVEAIPEQPLDSLELGPDTTICLGDTLELFTGYPNYFATWSDSSHDARLLVATTGTYWVRLQNACGIFSDTIRLIVNTSAAPFTLGADTVICEADDSLQLSGPDSLAQYQWNTGDTTRSIWVSQEGGYRLTVTNFCGYRVSDSIWVEGHQPLEIYLGPDTVLCPGQTLTLDAGITAFPVSWNDGTTGPVNTITRGGVYVARSTNACGTEVDAIRVRYRPRLNLEPETLETCQDDSIMVSIPELIKDHPTQFAGFHIQWADGFNRPVRYLSDSGRYVLEFTDRCSTYTKPYTYSKDLCLCPVFVPDAFTPNGDGVNDEFTVRGACQYETFRITVYNRWGARVFETEDPNEPWRGSRSGQELPQGVYTYYLRYSWDEVDQYFSQEKQGTIMLIR